MKRLSKQITLGVDPYTGRRIRKRIYADTPTKLKQAEKEQNMDFAKGVGPTTNITYKEYEAKWKDASWAHLQPRSKASYNSVLKPMVAVHYCQMAKLTRLDLQKIINSKWGSPEACIRLAQLMNAIWASAVFDGIVDRNIALGLKLPKKPKSERRALTSEELEAIGKADFTEAEKFMVDLLLQFGLRPQEAFAVSRTSFNRTERTLTINKAVSYDGSEPFLKGTKTGVTRTLPVPDSFWSKIPKFKGMYYFTDDDGKFFRLKASRKFAGSIISKINVALGGTSKIKATDMTLYTFRHNKASLLYYTQGISMKKKAEYMGHSEEMFLRTYSHLMEDKEDTEILRQAVV